MANCFLSRNNQWNCVVRFLLAAAILSGVATETSAQRLAKSRLKNGSAVLGAFREVVSEPSRSTVAVLTGKNKQIALGTIVGSDGYILTKSSEIKEQVFCKLKDGRKIEARVIGVHPEFDLAMLKIDAEGLVPVVWEEENSASIGQWLATSGLKDLPIAVGVVSVNPRRIRPQRGVLGVSIEEAESGAKITQVYPNTGAEEAGLMVGDVITRVAGDIIKDHSALVAAIRRFRPGDTLSLLVMRKDAKMSFRATLTPPIADFRNRSVFQNRMGGELSFRRGGFPSVFQHDTVLSPEQCGGPVVNLDGKVVGINIARAGRTASFAIPVSEILPLLDDLKSGKLAPPSEKPVIAAGTPKPPELPDGS